MAEAHEFDPFVNTEQVDEDEEMLRLLDQDIREIDEGRATMLTPEEAPERFRRWLQTHLPFPSVNHT